MEKPSYTSEAFRTCLGPYLSFAWSRRFPPLRAACNDPIDLQFFAEQVWRAADPSLRLEAFARVEALLKHDETWVE